MRSFGPLSVAFVALFGLAVGTKIWMRSSGGGEAVAPTASIVGAASRHGFWSTPRERGDAQLDRVDVTRGQCSAVVTVGSLLGIHRSAIRMAAAPGERVYFVYKGERYDDQPLWTTVTDHYLGRIAHVFGFGRAPTILLGVAASPYCGPDALRWLETDL